MCKYPLLCLLTGALAWSQAGTKPTTAPTTVAPSAPQKSAAASTGSDQAVGSQTPVITIPGICDQKPGTPKATCKTVVTRAEFDDLVETMAPNIQPAQKKQLANQYAMALVMAHKAHELHLDQGPKYEQRLKLAKLGVLNKELGQSLQEQAAKISADLQRLAYELRPYKLEYLGIVAVMKSFCGKFAEQHNVKIDFKSHDLPATLSVDISLCLMRVLQEGLDNSAKHSGARHFEVELFGTSEAIHLTLHDSGIGFDSQAAMRGPGLGLMSMKERLKLLKGEFSIDSQAKKGATIRARVPLAKQQI